MRRAELGQSFIAPPDVPRPIVEALRRAFDETMKDPEYLALSKHIGNVINPMSGAELTELNAKTLATPQSNHRALSGRRLRSEIETVFQGPGMSKFNIAGVELVTDHPGGLRTPVDQRPLLFRPIQMRGVTARNRIMLGPMSQYLAIDGNLTDWHLVHLGQFGIGGAGIVCSEETAVEARGRRTHHCAGMYTDEHVRGYRRITDFLKEMGAVPMIQLGHGGRRASVRSPWEGRGRCRRTTKRKATHPGRSFRRAQSPTALDAANAGRARPAMRSRRSTAPGRTPRSVRPTPASISWRCTEHTAT